MAASGKKGKKPKGKTFALTEFLADSATGTPSPVIRNKAWADEVDNDDDVYDASGSRNKQPVVLPTAPRATRNLNVDDENIPKNPPFNAYISNLQYDVAEDEIEEFFKDMKIVNVRLPRDDRGGGRLKGFGYVEFDSREALIAALNIGDTTIKGRRMRIEVAAASEGERRGAGGRGGREMGYDLRSDRGDGPDRTLGDWRSGPREDPPNDRNNSNRDNADGRPNDRGPFTRDNMDRGAFTRDNMDRSFNRESNDRGAFTRDNMDKSFNRENNDRGSFTRDNMDRGAFTRDNMDRSFNRDNNDRGSFTRDNMDRGAFTRDNMDRSFNRENADRGSDRGPFTRDNMDRSYARDGGDRGDRGDRGSYNRDNVDRDRGAFTRDNMDGGFQSRREGGSDRGARAPLPRVGSDREPAAERLDAETNGSPAPTAAPAERPRLQLQQRTVSATAPGEEAPPAAAASIFGGAKPVDTAARHRQIEERLAKQHAPAPRTEGSLPVEEVKAEAPEGGWPRRAAPPGPASPPAQNNHATQERGNARKPPAYNGGGGGRGAPAPAGRGGGAPRGVGGGTDPPPPRMPKMVDQAAPNFAVTNKFGLLPTEEDAANESD